MLTIIYYRHLYFLYIIIYNIVFTVFMSIVNLTSTQRKVIWNK